MKHNINTAVKGRACAREEINSRRPHANFPAQNHKKQTPCKISEGKLNCTRKSVKGNKRSKKGKLETFPTQSLFKYRFSIDLPFSFKLYQKSYTLLKHSVAFGI